MWYFERLRSLGLNPTQAFLYSFVQVLYRFEPYPVWYRFFWGNSPFFLVFDSETAYFDPEIAYFLAFSKSPSSKSGDTKIIPGCRNEPTECRDGPDSKSKENA